MTTPNHLIGGLVITGLFGSFINLNILSSPSYIITTLIASLLPDIDYPKSLIGKVFLPFSKYINRRYGHRTITHSFIALLVSSFIFGILENSFYDQNSYTKIYFLAFTSHLILDMMTVQGVPLLYPFLKNPCVLPGNPEIRFKTGDLRTETMIFCFFLLSGVFLQPLIKNGFWTQYNRFFGTPKHLVSEFNKSKDLLLVDYIIQKGTEEMKGQGYCIEASLSRIVLLENDKIRFLDRKDCFIKEVIPQHTGKELVFKTEVLQAVSADSLNSVLSQFRIKDLSIQSNTAFNICENGFYKKMKAYETDYPKDLFVETIAITEDGKMIKSVNNPRIKTLERKLAATIKDHQNQQNAFSEKLAKLKELQSLIQTENDLAIKERMRKEIHELQKLKHPESIDYTIQELQTQILELQKLDQIKELEQKNDLLSKLKTSQSVNSFSGTLTHFLIQDPA